MRATSILNQYRVAIIGSGPAGFYTSYRLIDKLPGVKVDMFEALPVPYGLARFGVAPDHPEVKNCQDKFQEVAENESFRFIGNVKIGKDLDLKDLKENYNSVVFAYGSAEDRKLGIPGEDLNGVFSAREFVGWYNGLPQFSGMNPPLEDAEDVVVVGNGNVGLDVARILLCDVSRLKSTDITEEAYEVLKNSRVKNVKMVGRRGLLQSAFTTKEIRELVKEPGVEFTPLDPKYIDSYRAFIPMLSRSIKRVIQVLDKAKEENAKKEQLNKNFTLEYLQSPVEFYANEKNTQLLSSTKVELNNLIQDDIQAPASSVSTGEYLVYKSELAFKSIGYKSLPIEGMKELDIPFDTRRGVIQNQFGRVVGEDSRTLPGWYVAGWVKNGPTGVIAETMRESFEVAETIMQDYYNDYCDKELRAGYDGVISKIRSRPVSWQDWLKIEKVENQRGQSVGKPRSKILSTDEMLNIL